MRNLPKLEDIFSSEVVAETRIAIKEVGEIKPWFDDETNAWVFEHDLYPERYGGDSPEEVIAGYPLYIAQLIQHRMDGTLSPETEKRIKGRGGQRKHSNDAKTL